MHSSLLRSLWFLSLLCVSSSLPLEDDISQVPRNLTSEQGDQIRPTLSLEEIAVDSPNKTHRLTRRGFERTIVAELDIHPLRSRRGGENFVTPEFDVHPDSRYVLSVASNKPIDVIQVWVVYANELRPTHHVWNRGEFGPSTGPGDAVVGFNGAEYHTRDYVAFFAVSYLYHRDDQDGPRGRAIVQRERRRRDFMTGLGSARIPRPRVHQIDEDRPWPLTSDFPPTDAGWHTAPPPNSPQAVSDEEDNRSLPRNHNRFDPLRDAESSA